MNVKQFITAILLLICIQDLVLSQNKTSGTEKPTVYLFLLEECVICQSYSTKINNIYEEYKYRFNFLAIFPSFISKPETIHHFLKEYKVQMPYKTDFYKTLVKKFNVKVTPEVVVYDHQNDNVLYKGRIDNEFFSIGRRRRSGINNELKIALDQILNDQKVDPKYTEAVGCIIDISELDGSSEKK